MTIDIDHLWSEIIDEQDGWRELHVNCIFADEVDLPSLLARPELDATCELWIEHWMTADALRDDYRPWFDALAGRPLPGLRSLTFGGYSDRSIDAHLGTAAGLAATLETLERLVLVGDGSQLVPIRAPRLRELWLEHGAFPAAVAREVLATSVLPSLVAARIRLNNMDGRDPDLATFGRIAALFERDDIKLEHLTLSGVAFARDDFAALLASPVTTHLKLLDLGRGCTVEGGAETVLKLRERLPDVLVVPPMGVEAAALVAGGLRSCARHELHAMIGPAVPSRW
ncbi:hypothetical protein [Nannocystis pusilla]|uniref:hypothetical protein n=1 Tax=Nannocystis pusilla TaxID=889268 RepID=UPI003DA51ECC